MVCSSFVCFESRVVVVVVVLVVLVLVIVIVCQSNPKPISKRPNKNHEKTDHDPNMIK